MCIAKPYLVLERKGNDAVVDLDGKKKSINCTLVPGLTKGDWVLLHGDMIIQQIEESDAISTLALIQELDCGCS